MTSKAPPEAHFMKLTAITLVMLAQPLIAHAQSRPDFTGEWTRIDSVAEQRSVAAAGDAAFRVGDMGSGWGSPLSLRQQGNQLVVEYTHFGTYDLQPKLRFVYALDGAESRNVIMVGHAESVLRSRAAWRDSTLAVSTTYRTPGGSMEVRQLLTLTSPTTLLLETTRGATTTRTRYRKG